MIFVITGYPGFPIAAFSASLRAWCVLGRSAAPRFLFCYLCRWGWPRLHRRVVCWAGASGLQELQLQLQCCFYFFFGN